MGLPGGGHWRMGSTLLAKPYCLPGPEHSTVSLKYHAATWYPLPPGAVYRGPQHGFSTKRGSHAPVRNRVVAHGKMRQEAGSIRRQALAPGNRAFTA